MEERVTVQEVKALLKKVLKEEIVALTTEKDDGLLLRFVGGQEFVLRVEEA